MSKHIRLSEHCYLKFSIYEKGTSYFVVKYGTLLEHVTDEFGMSACGALAVMDYKTDIESYATIPTDYDYNRTFYYNQEWEFHDKDFIIRNTENPGESRGEIIKRFQKNIGKINMYLENKYTKDALEIL